MFCELGGGLEKLICLGGCPLRPNVLMNSVVCVCDD